MSITRSSICKTSFAIALGVVLAALTAPPVCAADVTNPEEVAGLVVLRVGDDVELAWDPVTMDVTGHDETVVEYHMYRGDAPDFVPDKDLGSNRIGTSTTTGFTHELAATDGLNHYYLVSAVDAAVNEGATRASGVTTPPVLSGFWTESTIEVDWTDALPVGNVVSYRVYYGNNSGQYDFVDDVGLALSHSLTGLQANVNWYVAVTAVDLAGNESAFSNEHIDPVGGTIDMRVHDEAELCWGASGCPPADPEAIQRSDGFQYLLPADFPEGDWTRVDVTFTMDSRLCGPPTAPDKCGSNNPGWNPCGDPWDRTAHLFMVLDDCIQGTGSCMTQDNVELMRAITPFGTDAPPPDGSGVVPPRVLTLNITPLAPLLAGHRRYVGAHIGHYTPKGWWVTVDFHFSKDPAEASTRPPAHGFEQVFYHSGGEITTPRTVTIPPEADRVLGRFFITGHGGNAACDGGSADGQSCDTGCPGGSCQNCDEFCHREHKIMVDGLAEAWSVLPWRDDCTPGSITACSEWNACGWPSCTFSRAGWCPGYIACHHDAPCSQDIDLTSTLAPGGTYDLTWLIPVRNGSWSKSLVVYWYEPGTPFCGNGVIEGSEVCDGADTAGESCQSQGFDAGTLGCSFTCDGFDTDGCWNFACGNDICELPDGEDCLSCPQDCNGVQSGNPGNRFCCGDGEGDNPVDCSDSRCTASGNTCYQ